MARETIQKRLTGAEVRPSGTRNGHPVYRLRDVCPVLYGTAGFGEDGCVDPRNLRPEQRAAWYLSESRRLSVEMTMGQLIPAAQVEAGCAEIMKSLVQFLATLGDQLERDVALTPEQVDAMNTSIDRQREALYADLVQRCGLGEEQTPPEPELNFED